MTLSVIVPIYNAKDYLSDCLACMQQEPEAISELILVDDCSDDGSAAICDSWAKKDARIRVLHLPRNGGLSHARNTGIEVARGDYIAFVDADDTVQPGTFSACMRLLSGHPEVEIVEFPVWVHYGASDAYYYQPGKVGPQNYQDWLNRRGFLHSYAWNKVFHRRLWTSFRFPEGKKFEDMFTIPYVLHQARQLYVVSEGLYYYYSRPASITQSASLQAQKDLLEANLRFFDFLREELNRPQVELDFFYLHLCNLQIVCLEMGGDWMLPDWHHSLSMVFRAGLSPVERVKALGCCVSTRFCCRLFAWIRTWIS